jgi:hypothetical protein
MIIITGQITTIGLVDTNNQYVNLVFNSVVMQIIVPNATAKQFNIGDIYQFTGQLQPAGTIVSTPVVQ